MFKTPDYDAREKINLESMNSSLPQSCFGFAVQILSVKLITGRTAY
jgi:hypothetical protein